MNWFIFQHGFVPLRFTSHFGLGQFSTLITNIFIHADFWHLLGNIWFLYIFGDNIEDFLGHFNFLVFFIVCGIAADLANLFCNPLETIPSIGASGSIAGVLGAYLILHPNASIKTWWGDQSILFGFRTYNLPAWLIIMCWFVMQYFMIYLNVQGIGWIAHIGGFTTGMLAIMFFQSHINSQPVKLEEQCKAFRGCGD